MREAKAHFEEATLATPPSEPANPTSKSPQSTNGQAGPTPASGNTQAMNAQVRSGSDGASASDSTGSAPQAASSSNSSSLSSTSDRNISPAAEQSSQASSTPRADCNPQTALAAAHKATKHPGSSTALVLQLREGSNTLKASNLVSLSNHSQLAGSVVILQSILFKQKHSVCMHGN